MRRALRVVLAIMLVLPCFLCFPPAALAHDYEFTVDYRFSPNNIGSHGGTVTLFLTVKNDGSETITDVYAVINTKGGVNQHWDTSIAPGASHAVSAPVPLLADDLDRELTLMVSVYTGGSNPEGFKIIKFQIPGEPKPVVLLAELTPDRDGFKPGETVTVRLIYRNRLPGVPASEVMSAASVRSNGELVYTHPTVNNGEIAPGTEKDMSFSYTFTADDVGPVSFRSGVHYYMMGFAYEYNMDAYVHVLPLEIAFTAHLSATPAEVEPGGNAAFKVKITNTGADKIGGFSIRTTGGSELAAAGALAPGESKTITINRHVSEAGSFKYDVVGTSFGRSVSVTTNTVHVGIVTPATPSPEPTSSPTPEPTQTPEPTPTPTPEPTMIPEVSPSPVPTPAPTESPASTMPSSPSPTETAQPSAQLVAIPLWLLAVILAVLLLIAVIVVIYLVMRKIKRKQS